MNRFVVRAALVGLATLLGGCLVSQYEHFSMRKGVSVPLPDGEYSCSKERKSDKDSGMGPRHLLLHAAMFHGRIGVEKLETSEGVRYLVTESTDPTVAVVYAFHRIAGDIFVYSTTVVSPDKSDTTGVGFAMWFARITDRTIVSLRIEEGNRARTLARDHGVESKTERVEENLFGLSLEGTREDERRFVEAFAASGLLKPDSTCSKVDTPDKK